MPLTEIELKDKRKEVCTAMMLNAKYHLKLTFKKCLLQVKLKEIKWFDGTAKYERGRKRANKGMEC